MPHALSIQYNIKLGLFASLFWLIGFHSKRAPGSASMVLEDFEMHLLSCAAGFDAITLG